MKTLEKFRDELKLNEIGLLNNEIKAENFTQFNRAVSLARLVGASVETFKNKVYALYKEETNENWKNALSNVYGLSYSYIARLVQVNKETNEKISNYIEYCKENDEIPTLLGLLNFGKERDEPRKMPLSISYNGKKARLNEKGNFSTDLSPDELRALISYLQSQLL